jgi:protein tyrosine kinase modulator
MKPSIETDLEDSSTPRPAFSPLSIARTVWKRKAVICVVWALLTACTLAVVSRLPAVYMSEAVILVDSQKIPEKFVEATVASDLEDRIAAIRQQLLSSGELRKIIDDFGLYATQRKSHFEEEILEMMRNDISITLEPVSGNTKRPGAFRIGYQGPDPVLVTRVANRLTDLYVAQNLRTREGQAEGTSDFLDAQLRESKGRLDDLEAKVSAYKLKHNGELPQQEQSLASTLSRLQVELEANRDSINRAQQTKVILSSTLNAMEASLASQTRRPDVGPSAESGIRSETPATQPGPQTRKRSEALEEQLDLLRARYSEDHPDVIRMRTDLEKVKRAEEQEESAASSSASAKSTPPSAPAVRSRRAAPTVESAEAVRTREQIAGLKAQLTVTDKELEERKAQQQRILRDTESYQIRIERLPVREQEMAQLTRDYEMSKENYKSLLDKRMAAEMALDMERRQKSERFTVLDRAKVPEKPVKPKKPMLYGGGLAVSLMLALITGFVIELRTNVFLGEWELPAETTILARLPYIEVAAASEGPSRRTARF